MHFENVACGAGAIRGPATQQPESEYLPPTRTVLRVMQSRWTALIPIFFVILVCSFPKPSGGEVTFDPSQCNASSPCCVSGDDVSIYMGPLTKSFCKIEYPTRVSVNWDQKTARILDKKAEISLKTLTDRGCQYEACKGFVCAEYFPRCFYVDTTTQGAFLFETCRETCEQCYSTCSVDESPRCGGNPSQYEIACTSDSSALTISRLLLGAVVLLCLRLVVL